MFDIKLLRISLGWTQTKLSEHLGVSKSMISQIEKGITPLPDLWIPKLEALKLSNINSFVKSNNVTDVINGMEDAIDITKKFFSISRFVPVIDQVAYATPVDEWDTPEWLNERQYIPTILPEDGKYYWFPIRGDSMSRENKSTIEDGDYILARELYRHHWKYPLQLNRVQVWIIKEMGKPFVCKEITRHNAGTGIITLHSWNPMYADEDYEVHLDHVEKMYYFKELKREKL